MKTLIYEISKNNKPVYIGKSKEDCIISRKSKHKKRWGDNITLIIIDEIEGVDKQIWKPLESYWINQYKNWGFNIENKNEGGNGKHATKTVEWKKEYNKKYNEIYNLNKPWRRYYNLEYRQQWHAANPDKQKLYRKKHNEKCRLKKDMN